MEGPLNLQALVYISCLKSLSDIILQITSVINYFDWVLLLHTISNMTDCYYQLVFSGCHRLVCVLVLVLEVRHVTDSVTWELGL